MTNASLLDFKSKTLWFKGKLILSMVNSRLDAPSFLEALQVPEAGSDNDAITTAVNARTTAKVTSATWRSVSFVQWLAFHFFVPATSDTT